MSLEIGESSHIQWHFFAFWVEKMGYNTFLGDGPCNSAQFKGPSPMQTAQIEKLNLKFVINLD